MRKWVLIAGVLLVIAGGAGVFLRTKTRPAQAGIQIEATPQAAVFINDQEVGTTPYEAGMPPQDMTLRLVPLSSDMSLSPWTRKIALTEGVKTVVKRDFGESEEKSAGEILSFEKIPGKEAALAIVSTPDSAELVIDGERVGFTPIRRDSLSVGKHQIAVSRPGYAPRELSVTTVAGYKLTAVVMLAGQEASPSAEATDSATPAKDASKKTEVEILDTPTGFLRVREEPSTAATEAARIDPGKKFPYLDQNKDGSWYKIEYEKGKTGWISAQYAKKTEAKGQ